MKYSVKNTTTIMPAIVMMSAALRSVFLRTAWLPVSLSRRPADSFSTSAAPSCSVDPPFLAVVKGHRVRAFQSGVSIVVVGPVASRRIIAAASVITPAMAAKGKAMSHTVAAYAYTGWPTSRVPPSTVL